MFDESVAVTSRGLRRRRARTGLEVLLLGTLSVGPASAQSASVFGGRTVLQYNDQGDKSFGGWRLGFNVGPTDELGLQLSAARWGRLRSGRNLPGADGFDLLATVRYSIVSTRAVAASLEAGLGTFRGPEAITGNNRPTGKAVIVGLSFLVVPVWPIGLEAGGYFRDDAGSFDLEARVGVRALLRRVAPPENTQLRIGLGTLSYRRLSGVTSGDGLGVGLELERKYRRLGGVVSVDIVPVRTQANNQPGFFDSSLILFWGGARLRSGVGRPVTPFVTAGPLVAGYLEGPLSGARLGAGVEFGLEVEKKLGRAALVLAPAARFLVFDGSDSGLESAFAWRFSVRLRFRE